MKDKKEELDKKFTDNWWLSTQGRNDIRNKAIKELITKNYIPREVVEGLKDTVNNLPIFGYLNDGHLTNEPIECITKGQVNHSIDEVLKK